MERFSVFYILMGLLLVAVSNSMQLSCEDVDGATAKADKGNKHARNEFVWIEGKQYYISTDVLSWEDALRQCASLRMVLISFETQQKYEAIDGYLNSKPLDELGFYWTSGLRIDKKINIWSSSGHAMSSDAPWDTDFSQPDNAGSCVGTWEHSITNRRGLHDTICERLWRYICEYPCIGN